MTTVISVENVSKQYRLGTISSGTLSHDLNRAWARARGKPDPMLKIGQEDLATREGEYIWALRDVSFEVKEGEVLGIIGRNGAGKSTLLKILSRVTAPTSGQIKVKGRIASLLEVGTGFHPELTGRENVFLNGAILGMSRAEIQRKFDEIVAFAEVEKFIDTPVKRYSSGMYVRLAFAVAAYLEPEILLVDEVLAVGDVAFQKKCLGKMREAGYSGKTVLVVSHNMETIASICRRAILLSSGFCESDGEVGQVISAYEKSNRSIEGQGDRIKRSLSGQKRAWIDWLEIRDDARNHRTVFENGEYLNLIVGLSGQFPEATYFEWVLFTEKGHPATSGGTFIKERDITFPTPSGSLHAHVGPLPLAEGRYTLTLRLGVLPGRDMLDVWEDANSILISKCVPESGGIPFDTRRGVIYVPADYADGGTWADFNQIDGVN